MKIGVYRPELMAYSLGNYTDNIVNALVDLGVDIQLFQTGKSAPPNVDLYWDPRSAGGGTPPRQLTSTEIPLIVTLHGFDTLSMSSYESFSWWGNLKRSFWNWVKLYRWHGIDGHYAKIITVSDFAACKLIELLKIPPERIASIYHGVNNAVFHSNDEMPIEPSYFFHISTIQLVRKNVERILSAYEQITVPHDFEFVILAAGYDGKLPYQNNTNKVRLIRSGVKEKELTELYQSAIGLVFPSLYESFGMPILEAMASGCPVITSNGTGCAEVAGDAALTVDPYSVDEIAGAMQQLIDDESLRKSLRQKGLARAAEFSWEKSATEHLEVFESVLKQTTATSSSKPVTD